MNLDATLWAWSAPVTSSAQRLVLLSMADRAGEDMTAFPSILRIGNGPPWSGKRVESRLFHGLDVLPQVDGTEGQLSEVVRL